MKSRTTFRAVIPSSNNALLLEALQYEDILRAMIYRITHNNADVEELLQDVYAQILTCQPGQLRNHKAYIIRVARNTALDWFRHQKCVPIELLADINELERLDEAAFVEEIIESHQKLVQFVNATQQLSPQQRRVFVLKKVYGYSQKQIADHLKIAENTVEQHMTHALRNLARILGTAMMNDVKD